MDRLLNAFMEWLYEDAMQDLGWFDDIIEKVRQDLSGGNSVGDKREALEAFDAKFKELLGD